MMLLRNSIEVCEKYGLECHFGCESSPSLQVGKMGLGRCGRWLWLRCTVGESGALVTADRIADEIADGHTSTILYALFIAIRP